MAPPVQLALLPLLYGLDIETDTAVDGLDPARSAIVAVALATEDDVVTFTGPEPQLLRSLDRHLRRLPAGVLVTWNGSGFDLPFLADRARARRVALGLRITADDSRPHKHPPLAGHASHYRGRWHRHAHLDACCLYRTLRPADASCALKRVARDAGLLVVEEDRERLHELGRGALVRYAASDAQLARLLALRAWLHAGPMVDAA